MNKPATCSTHRDQARTVRMCATCQRIACEQRIVTRAIDAMLQAGYLLCTNDGDSLRPETPTADRAAIMAEIMEVDDEYLMVYARAHNGTAEGWIRFVYGNDGYDVISDYTTNLEAQLSPVNAYADTQDVR